MQWVDFITRLAQGPLAGGPNLHEWKNIPKIVNLKEGRGYLAAMQL